MRSNVSAPPAASKTVRASIGGSGSAPEGAPEDVPEGGPERGSKGRPERGWRDIAPFYATTDAPKPQAQHQAERRPTRPRRYREHRRDDEVGVAVGVPAARAAQRADTGDKDERWRERADHREDGR